MKNRNLKFRILALTFSVFYSLFFVFYSANAQSSFQFLVSWSAYTYVPSWYQGKIFPARDSRIEVSFELIDNNKIADLSREKVRWYINDKLVLNENDGLGIKSLRFRTTDYAGFETEVKITIFDYKGRGGEIVKIIRIPIAGAEVIIDAPYSNNQIKTGKNSFWAIPFFFNIKEIDSLSIDWLANGQKPEQEIFDEYPWGNPWQLDLNVDSRAPAGFEINLQAVVKNLLNQMEFASKSIKAVIK